MQSKSSFSPTPSQERAIERIKAFIKGDSQVLILTGYAGTGKTTLIKIIVELLTEEHENFALMASTGRAAKIVKDKVGIPTTTIHGMLYTFNGFNKDLDKFSEEHNPKTERDGQLLLCFEAAAADNDNYDKKVYIIDEASMIADEKELNPTQATFGTGSLLTDLLNFDTKGKYIFVGDSSQLPPVLQSFSPALSANYLRQAYGKSVEEVTLTEIMRQSDDNDILEAAHRVRRLVDNPPQIKWAKFPLKGYNNITLHGSAAEMQNNYISLVKEKGYNYSTLICRGNRTCMQTASFVRQALGFHNQDLNVGELLLVTQNNNATGLMNGDLVEIIQLGQRFTRANLTFREIEVQIVNTEKRISQLIIEDILFSGETNISGPQQTALFMDYFYRMREQNISPKSLEFRLGLFSDPWLNALRAVFGYAITCHKAQGGEWEHVFLDIPRGLPLNAQSEAYQWLYTGITRAKTQLHIVKDFFIG